MEKTLKLDWFIVKKQARRSCSHERRGLRQITCVIGVSLVEEGEMLPRYQLAIVDGIERLVVTEPSCPV
jgi:hypothetical protein